MIVLSGNSHPGFADAICRKLGLPHSKVILKKFANGETGVEIGVSLRDKDVYIVQTGYDGVNDNFIELLIMVHAAKIASARRISAVVPYFPYSKQCSTGDFTSVTQVSPRRSKIVRRSLYVSNDFQGTSDSSDDTEPYNSWAVQSNTLVAKMLVAAGADHVITMDLHDPQFQGFFDIPVDNLPSLPMMVKCIRNNWPNTEDLVIVSPDAGGAKRASKLADALHLNFALVHQDRKTGPEGILVGKVKGLSAVLVDDIVDTSETLVRAAQVLHDQGAAGVFAVITHGIFADDSLALIKRSKIEKLFVSNTIPQEAHLMSCPEKLVVFSAVDMFAEAVRRTHNGESISYLYEPSAFE